jgi:hypothetical protein
MFNHGKKLGSLEVNERFHMSFFLSPASLSGNLVVFFYGVRQRFQR